MLAPHLTEEGHLAVLNEAAGKSKREIEEFVARIAPRPAVPTSIRKLPTAVMGGAKNDRSDGLPCSLSANGSGGVGAEATAPWPALPATAGEEGTTRQEDVLCSSAQLGSLGAVPQPPLRPRAAGRVEPLSNEAYKVTFTASRRLRDKLRQAQDLLGHQVPGGDLAEIVERGLDLLMKDVRPSLHEKEALRPRRPRRGG